MPHLLPTIDHRLIDPHKWCHLRSWVVHPPCYKHPVPPIQSQKTTSPMQHPWRPSVEILSVRSDYPNGRSLSMHPRTGSSFHQQRSPMSGSEHYVLCMKHIACSCCLQTSNESRYPCKPPRGCLPLDCTSAQRSDTFLSFSYSRLKWQYLDLYILW